MQFRSNLLIYLAVANHSGHLQFAIGKACNAFSARAISGPVLGCRKFLISLLVVCGETIGSPAAAAWIAGVRSVSASFFKMKPTAPASKAPRVYDSRSKLV